MVLGLAEAVIHEKQSIRAFNEPESVNTNTGHPGM